jgi:hypothetical protein
MALATWKSFLKIKFFQSKARLALSAIGVACVGILFSAPANAVPSYANQTGQSCVACHAGGQFFELTPYGRLFKLTGYTQGEKTTPLAAMIIASYTSIAKNDDGAGGKVATQDNTAILDTASLFVAGKFTDNIGSFAQFSTSLQGGNDAFGNAGSSGVATDQFDVRYADRKVDGNSDLIWGATLHNNPGVQDVFNSSSSAFSFPMQGPANGTPSGLDVPATQIEGGVNHVLGTGGYVYLNKAIYAELSAYQSASGAASFLRYGAAPGYVNLDGNSFYARLAYTHDWGPHSIMLGGLAFDTKVFSNDPLSGAPLSDLGSTHYRDVGVDAQYQYILSPHTVTAHFRAINEAIDDSNNLVFANKSNTLNTMMARINYVYRDKYGASLAYKEATGSSDATAYAGNTSLTPDTQVWTPEVFWTPVQNVRVGLQFNFFTKYQGSVNGYDSASGLRNASDNNSTYAYMWTAF